MLFCTRLALCGAVILTVLAATQALPLARAEPQADPPGYAPLIDEALSEMRGGHFVEARALFERAHVLYPNARTLRGLGMMAYELRSYAESVAYFEQALQATEKPLDPALRSNVETQLKKALRFVALLRLALAPPETRVSVDGQPAVQVRPGELPLDAADHLLTFEAPGYRGESRRIEVRGGETLLWSIGLQLSDAAGNPDSASTAVGTETVAAHVAADNHSAAPARSERTRLYRNPWIWIGTAVVASAIAAGLAIGLRSEPKTVNDPPVQTANSPPDAILQTLVGTR